MIVIKGGLVLTPDGWEEVDVAVDSRSVTAVGQGLGGRNVVDASGCLVGPGFVDVHTHLREPGQTWKEDIRSGSQAAAAGGFTAIVAMPNTSPALDTPDLVLRVRERSREVGVVEVIPSAALTMERRGQTLTDLIALHQAGVRLFTDDGDPVTDNDLLLGAMKRLGDLEGAVLAQHAEDVAVTALGSMHEGSTSRRLGIDGWSPESESEIVDRDLEMVAETGVRYHVQHVSSRLTIDLIRNAKGRGLSVTAEVTPHHLIFDETSIDGTDANFKMYPPLREADDRAALVGALSDGTVDMVATDHAPHTTEEKSVSFQNAPRGVIGLETAASAVWQAIAHPDRLFNTMSRAPAQLIGLTDHGQPIAPGVEANLVVFDPNAEWTAGSFRSKSSNSPFLGHGMRGKVAATVFRGAVVYQNGDRV